MRKDMGKIITERERHSSSLGSEKFGKTIRWDGWDGDYDQPKRHSGSKGRTYGWEGKEFSDVLGPLKKWLDKQVGRPWNKLYSEISEVLDKRKVTHKHVLDHLYRWVALTAFYGVDGVWHDRSGSSWYVPEYYVNPRTGLLCKNKVETKAQRMAKWKKRQEEEKKNLKDLFLDDKHCTKVGGIWYWVEYREASFREQQEYSRGGNNGVFYSPDRKWMRRIKKQMALADLKRIREFIGD